MMKKMLNSIKGKVAQFGNRIFAKSLQAKAALSCNRGEGYIDTAIKILLAVVLGALLLAGLYALFGDTVLPTLTRRIKEMFDYAG